MAKRRTPAEKGAQTRRLHLGTWTVTHGDPKPVAVVLEVDEGCIGHLIARARRSKGGKVRIGCGAFTIITTPETTT